MADLPTVCLICWGSGDSLGRILLAVKCVECWAVWGKVLLAPTGFGAVRTGTKWWGGGWHNALGLLFTAGAGAHIISGEWQRFAVRAVHCAAQVMKTIFASHRCHSGLAGRNKIVFTLLLLSWWIALCVICCGEGIVHGPGGVSLEALAVPFLHLTTSFPLRDCCIHLIRLAIISVKL